MLSQTFFAEADPNYIVSEIRMYTEGRTENSAQGGRILRKITLMSMCFLFLVFALVFMGPISTVRASSQIVPPVDPSMSDVVAFDISKGQWTDDVPGFITDLQAAGFTVATVDISTGIPNNVMKIIVLSSQAGHRLPSPYTAAEGTMLANWVSNGGELMINGEHSYFVPDFEELMKAFGVTPQNNYVLDETDSDWARLPWPNEYHKSWVYYQSDNFAAHPILVGVTEVQFLAGCSLDAPSGAIITTDPDAVYQHPTFPNIYIGIPNVPVAVALQWGSGRVAMFGDTSWLVSVPLGYNQVDNAKVAMQTISWLNEEAPPPQEHDVEAISQTVTENRVSPGTLVDIVVTVRNNGDFTETFYVTCYYDSVEIGTKTVVDLAPGATTTVTFTWDTTGVPLNRYEITAWADSGEVIVEVDEDNNWCEMFVSMFIVPEEEEEHDVEAVSQTVAENEVLPGTLVDIVVTVHNPDAFTESFDVTCYYDSVEIGTQRVENLAPGATTTVTFTWDTNGVPLNGYMITAWADSGMEIVEIDEDNNWCEMPLPIFVIPELPFGAILALAACMAALAVFKTRKARL